MCEDVVKFDEDVVKDMRKICERYVVKICERYVVKICERYVVKICERYVVKFDEDVAKDML